MSFTIKCDKCGNEAKLTEAIHEVHRYKYWKSDNETLGFNYFPVYHEGHLIECTKCNNLIKQDE